MRQLLMPNHPGVQIVDNLSTVYLCVYEKNIICMRRYVGGDELGWSTGSRRLSA